MTPNPLSTSHFKWLHLKKDFAKHSAGKLRTMLKCSLALFFPEEIKAKEDGGERIRLLQDKINEMRKMYSSLKAEVASIDRKKKRLKKKRGVFLFFLTLLSSKCSLILRTCLRVFVSSFLKKAIQR